MVLNWLHCLFSNTVCNETLCVISNVLTDVPSLRWLGSSLLPYPGFFRGNRVHHIHSNLTPWSPSLAILLAAETQLISRLPSYCSFLQQSWSLVLKIITNYKCIQTGGLHILHQRKLGQWLFHPIENTSQDSFFFAKIVRKISPGEFRATIVRTRIIEKGIRIIISGRGNMRSWGDSRAMRTFMVNDLGCSFGS